MNFSEDFIREIVEKAVRGQGTVEKKKDGSGVLAVKTDTVVCEPFKQPGVAVKDIVTLEEAPRIGAGVMELKETDFEWTLSYDEFDMVIEGELEIVTKEGVIRGKKGDILYIPKGSHIHFRTPSYARFAYFVYPADWQKN
ncbi:MAG: cupin domain-containing protein [Ruminococcus sp.]|jgi:ethanolamine utilization protein EutQ